MEILSWGANSHGQLGQGVISEQCTTPQLVRRTWSFSAKQIAGGGAHSLLLDEEGQVFGCGWNQQNQLGCENKIHKYPNLQTFTKIYELSGISFHSLCAGWDSSAGITNKHVLFLWGSNSHGQLGLPKEHFPKYVKPIQLELRAKCISMGLRHTILVDVNGHVWTTGCGKRGQLGFGDNVINLDAFKKIPNIYNVDNAKCGQHHSIAWSKIDNNIYAWGDNTYGQLGFGMETQKSSTPAIITILNRFVDQIVSVHCGWTHSAVLLNDGRAVYWGRNNYGQLGCPSNQNFNIVSINEIPIRQLSIGSEHSICLLEDNSVWSWGWNEHGNTGIENTQIVTRPQRVNVVTGQSEKTKLYSGAGHNFLVVS